MLRMFRGLKKEEGLFLKTYLDVCKGKGFLPNSSKSKWVRFLSFSKNCSKSCN